MDDPIERAFGAFKEFGEAMAGATTPAERRARWEAWANARGGYPAVDRKAAEVGGVDVEWVKAAGVTDGDPVVIFLHGGGFSSGSTVTHMSTIANLSDAARCRVLGVNYRLFPEHPFPTQIEDAVDVYRTLIRSGSDPRRVALAGDSAGGGLAVAALLLAKTLALPMPAATVCIGPWVDLAVTGASMTLNADTDPVVKGEGMRAGALRFLDGVSPYHPLASPIYGDLSGLPPMLIQVGSGESLLDDARRLAGRARQCGVKAELKEWPGMVHGWHQFADFLPQAREALSEIREFLDALPGWR